MKKLLLIAFVITALLFGCKKEEEKKPCEIYNTGSLTLQNNTSLSVEIEIDGSYYTLSTGQSITKDVSAGVHNYQAISTDGLHTWSGSKDIVQCAEGTITFIL